MQERTTQDLLAERRANVRERMRERDDMARAMLSDHIGQIDEELSRRRAAEKAKRQRLVDALPACPACGDPPTIDVWIKPIPIRGFDVEIGCSGTCDDENTPTKYGATLAEACKNWRDYVDEEKEPDDDPTDHDRAYDSARDEGRL